VVAEGGMDPNVELAVTPERGVAGVISTLI